MRATMKHRITALTALAALALFALLSACGKKEETPKAAADIAVVVNGHEISRPLFDVYVKNRTGHSAKDLGATDKAKLLDDLVEMVLVADAPRTVDAAAKATLDAQLEFTRLALNAQQKVDELLKAEPSEQELKAEYDAQIKLMAGAREYLTRHIVVANKEQAEGIIKELKSGADFIKLAHKTSTDPQTQQGVVFWVGTGPADKPFADAVRTLDKGEVVTAPVQSQFGWHVIRLEDTRAATPPDYEGAKKEIRQGLQQKQLKAVIDDLKKTAKTDKRI
jgi:peptidyl-prolyl cis-trans isomerase C